MEKFNKLYLLSNLKNQVVRVLVVLWNCYDHDSMVFRIRPLRSWELDEVNLLDKIISSVILTNKEDILIWKTSGNKFSTKNGMNLWRKHDCRIDWQWKFILKILDPPNTKLFLWKVHSEILPTNSFLKKRIGDHFTSIVCHLCGQEEEDQIHLLWKCAFSKQVWQAVLSWWGLAERVYIEDLASM